MTADNVACLPAMKTGDELLVGWAHSIEGLIIIVLFLVAVIVGRTWWRDRT
jgi:hypothetical protein